MEEFRPIPAVSPLDICELRMLILSHASVDVIHNISLTSKMWHNAVAIYLTSAWRASQRKNCSFSGVNKNTPMLSTEQEIYRTSELLGPLRTFLLDNYLWGSAYKRFDTRDMQKFLTVALYFCSFTPGKGIVNLLMLILTGIVESQQAAHMALTIDGLQRSVVPLATLTDLLDIVAQLFSYYGSLLQCREQALLIRMWKRMSASQPTELVSKEIQTVRDSKKKANDCVLLAHALHSGDQREISAPVAILTAGSLLEELD